MPARSRPTVMAIVAVDPPHNVHRSGSRGIPEVPARGQLAYVLEPAIWGRLGSRAGGAVGGSMTGIRPQRLRYRLRVRDEPRNAASDAVRAGWPATTLEVLTRQEALSAFDHEFVREDRRKLIGLPPANAQEYIKGMVEYFSLDDERAPEFVVDSIVAVRGDRLVLARLRIEFRSGWSSDFLVIVQQNASIDRLQKAIRFDTDDIDAAMTELERLHAEIDAAER